jgi:hypothetical protein
MYDLHRTLQDRKHSSKKFREDCNKLANDLLESANRMDILLEEMQKRKEQREKEKG